MLFHKIGSEIQELHSKSIPLYMKYIEFIIGLKLINLLVCKQYIYHLNNWFTHNMHYIIYGVIARSRGLSIRAVPQMDIKLCIDIDN